MKVKVRPHATTDGVSSLVGLKFQLFWKSPVRSSSVCEQTDYLVRKNERDVLPARNSPQMPHRCHAKLPRKIEVYCCLARTIMTVW